MAEFLCGGTPSEKDREQVRGFGAFLAAAGRARPPLRRPGKLPPIVATAGNPYRDPAARIELGERAQSELMTGADWQEMLARWAHQEAAGVGPLTAPGKAGSR